MDGESHNQNIKGEIIMLFTCRIHMDNEAFEDSYNGNHDELIRILGMVTAGLENHGDGGELRDINGNFVGDWEITDMDDEEDFA